MFTVMEACLLLLMKVYEKRLEKQRILAEFVSANERPFKLLIFFFFFFIQKNKETRIGPDKMVHCG